VVTFYCACALCCGKADGITASGVPARAGRTVAANHLAFGTRVHLPGLGWRVVEDRLHRRHHGRIDVYVRTHSEAQRLGLRRLRVSTAPGNLR
jgi:3D (Asp-Asp-Asp) domain-containing protein